MFSPSAELARTHIRAAIEHVLTRPAIRGELAASRILETLLDEGFPNDSSQASDLVRGLEVTDLSNDSLKVLFGTLLVGLFNSTASATQRGKRLVALSALRNHVTEFVDTSFGELLAETLAQQDLWSWTLLVTTIQRAPWIQSYLDHLQRGRLIQFIRNVDVTDIDGAKFLAICMTLDITKKNAIKRIADMPTIYLSLNDDVIPRRNLLEEGVRRLLKSDSWSTTYEVAEKLIIPNSRLLTAGQINRLANAILTKNNINGSVIMEKLLREILLINDPQRLGSKEQWYRVLGKCGAISSEQKKGLEGYVENAYSDVPIPF